MRKIKNLDDLKAAITLPSWFETVQDMNAWLPELAASLSWQTRLSPHFLLHYYNDNPQGEKDNLGDTFAGTLEQIYTPLEQFLQIIPQSKQEKLASQTRLIWFILQTRTGRTFGSLTDPYVLFYLMDILIISCIILMSHHSRVNEHFTSNITSLGAYLEA